MERLDFRDGITLNSLLARSSISIPTAAKSGRANNPFSAHAIREIPVRMADSEAISLCLGTMTGNGSFRALDGADLCATSATPCVRPFVQPWKKTQREPSRETRPSESTKRLRSFRAKFVKNTATLELGYNDSLTYFTTVASLSRLLNDPSMMKLLEKLDSNTEERTSAN